MNECSISGVMLLNIELLLVVYESSATLGGLSIDDRIENVKRR